MEKEKLQSSSHSVTVSVTGAHGATLPSTAPVAFGVIDGALNDITPVQSLTATEGNDTGSRILATFTDDNPQATAADFPSDHLAINWNVAEDSGETSNGTIQFVSTDGLTSTWNVLGSHVYREPNSYRVGVSVLDGDGSHFTTTHTIFLVTDASLVDATLVGSGRARLMG